ncbi:MAG TPA: hypothetical protein VHX88_19870 [Solirubrobacteraceae bacterium]|jgi:hypothetical protein|nr:hypothetical protein [Solirubrobacteraceae bacterium]
MPPPVDRLIPRFAAEPPQEDLPYGRWEARLRDEFLAACQEIDPGDDELGDLGEVEFFPDRTWHGRTYIPATLLTSGGFEIFGYVRFIPGQQSEGPQDLQASVDYTDETADRNPEWTLDLCDEVIGRWRGNEGETAAMTLVWGRSLVAGGAFATGELDEVIVDQCPLNRSRFTLIAPDDYFENLLSIAVYGKHGVELARESLYGDEDEDGGGEGDEE